MKLLLMMRTKGLSGPFMSKHKCVPGLSTSAGNFIGSGQKLGLFRFNGVASPSLASTYVFNPLNEGAISAQFNTDDPTSTLDICGADTNFMRVQAGGEYMRANLFGITSSHLGLVINSGSNVSWLTWPAAGNGGLTLNGTSSSQNRGATTPSFPFYIGRSRSTTSSTFKGLVWDIKIFSDQAMTNLIHHWPMDEGEGNVFHDIVGGDDVTFDLIVGEWV